MRNLNKRKGLTIITIVYWFLLTYIVTALFFSFYLLVRQSNQMAEIKIQQLKKDEVIYERRLAEIEAERKRKTIQYIGEGVVFLVFILIGSVFVYRATRRQIRLKNQQNNFMMAVTHELKTPIAIAKLNLETLQKRKLNEEQQQRLIINALQEANRLNDLCENILLAARIDSGHYTLNKEKLDFSEMVASAAHYFASRFPQSNIKTSIQDGVIISGDTLLLQLAINNIIENAIKYGGEDKLVLIELDKQNQNAILQIKDNGIGINEEDKQLIFQKFYRSGSEATRKTKGTGLGLFLSQKIIYDHKGTIQLYDNKPIGSIFAITLTTDN